MAGLRLGVVQMRPEFGEVARNISRLESLLGRAMTAEQRDAAISGTGNRPEGDERGGPWVWVAPELCFTGYQFRSRDEAYALSEEIPGPITEALCRMSRRWSVVIVAGMAERSGDKVFNSAVTVSVGRVVDVYRKVHLFSDEKLWFDAGSEPFRVVEAGPVRVGVMICFDWVFPEAARSLALQGADVLCHPANLVLPYCQAAMITRCIENRVWAATANRVGSEDRAGRVMEFTGQSQVVSPAGEVVLRMGRKQEAAGSVAFDPAAARDKRFTARNDLFSDRRPTAYCALLTRPDLRQDVQT